MLLLEYNANLAEPKLIVSARVQLNDWKAKVRSSRFGQRVRPVTKPTTFSSWTSTPEIQICNYTMQRLLFCHRLRSHLKVQLLLKPRVSNNLYLSFSINPYINNCTYIWFKTFKNTDLSPTKIFKIGPWFEGLNHLCEHWYLYETVAYHSE